MIGHQVLLNYGDSISRVLPIVKEGDRYKIPFNTEFEFKPQELINTVNRVITETQLANSYIVEVENCETGEVVYSYEMNYLEQTDIIPCQSRTQPKSCYSLLVTLIDPIGIDQANLEVITNTTSPSISSNGLLYAFYGLLLAFAVLIGYFLWKRRKTNAIDPNLIPLGEYKFDKRNTELLIQHKRIELTSKEADLLLLLYNAANTTVERERILNRVWGDEGDYVGRTLDVFISKLRKKLEFDSKVKIVNIRGVGYKLVMDNSN
ncbi:MAG: winged helix-turn-helix domain-containing protein [Bacteroidia bacterium]|nr:winged helix-turn-helix domain-containing protein [Bacteroidia bacterium]